MESENKAKSVQGVGKLNSKRAPKEAETSFKIKTKGYTEQFSSYQKAVSVFERLKRGAEKKKQPIKIEFLRKTHGKDWEMIDFCEIKASFYDERD